MFRDPLPSLIQVTVSLAVWAGPESRGSPVPWGTFPRPPGPSKASLAEGQMTHTVFEWKK